MIPFGQKDKKIHWQFVVARKFSPFCEYIFSMATGLGDYRAIFGYKHSYRRMNINGDLFYCKEDVLKEQEKQLGQAKNNLKLVAWRVGQAEREGEKLIKFAYNIRNKNFDKLTNQQIQEILLKFLAGFYRFVPFLMMPLTLESYLEEELDRYLNKKYKNNQDKIRNIKSIILTPSRKNLQEEEQISILKLAGEFKAQRKITKSLVEKIKKHVEKFGMLGLRYGIGDIWKTEDIIKRIKALGRNNPEKKYTALIYASEKNEKMLGEIIKELKPDKRNKKIIKIIREYIFLRTYRTNVLNNSLAIIKPFLEKIAKRLKIDWKKLNYMILPEVIGSLRIGIVPKEFLTEVEKRKNGFATIFIHGKFFIFTGKEIQELASFWGLEQKISKTETIKGVAANVGKARGIAKIIYVPEDNKKVKNGDILVTSMTTPNFVPAMERAAAFVTDEGGILCHAAIVSREMQKPCIINTKIATKALRDGDLVEVDANKGVVKIIKAVNH